MGGSGFFSLSLFFFSERKKFKFTCDKERGIYELTVFIAFCSSDSVGSATASFVPPTTAGELSSNDDLEDNVRGNRIEEYVGEGTVNVLDDCMLDVARTPEERLGDELREGDVKLLVDARLPEILEAELRETDRPTG